MDPIDSAKNVGSNLSIQANRAVSNIGNRLRGIGRRDNRTSYQSEAQDSEQPQQRKSTSVAKSVAKATPVGRAISFFGNKWVFYAVVATILVICILSAFIAYLVYWVVDDPTRLAKYGACQIQNYIPFVDDTDCERQLFESALESIYEDWSIESS